MMGRKESIMFNYAHRESVVNPYAVKGSFVMDPYQSVANDNFDSVADNPYANPYGN